MATTQAQAAVMRQTADKFDQVNQTLQTMLRSLLGELEGLRTQWQGAGGRSFEQVKIACRGCTLDSRKSPGLCSAAGGTPWLTTSG